MCGVFSLILLGSELSLDSIEAAMAEKAALAAQVVCVEKQMHTRI